MRTHSIAPTRPLLVVEDLRRVAQDVQLDALFLGMMHLFQTGGHLRLAAAIDDVHMLRAETLRAARGIHSNVAAADDRNGACERMTGVSLSSR